MFNNIEIKEINTQAKRDLVKKLQLERTFEPEIKSLFAQMHRDFKTTVAATGQAPSANDYTASWEIALRKHYERVQKSFLGVVDIDKKLFEDLLQLALLAYRKTRSIAQALYITRTNSRDMADSITKARQTLTEQDLPTDNASLARAATVNLKRKTKGRVEAIKTLETQAPAEDTKLKEVRTQAGLRPTETREAGIKKTFRTMGDIKVRTKPFSHKAANFQTVDINEPFVVGGQLMMYPGDTSLGASIGNVSG